MTYENDDDPTAARLRAALDAEADMVTPSDDGLSRIRERTDAGERPWWQHPGVLAVAAAVVLGLVVGGGFALLGGDGSTGDGNVVAGQTSSEPEQSSPAPSETAATTEATDPPVDDQTVWVYYVMDVAGSGPRLYREQHAVPAGPPAAAAAVQEMLSAPPADPDYTSGWPEGTELLGYEVSGDTATVDLSQATIAGARGEAVAMQEVVYTVTANEKAVKQVRVRVNGDVPPSGHSDWSQPISRAPMVDVQGFIWLLSPTEASEVESPVEIVGYGTAFEGTVSWEVRRAGSGEVVAEGFTQAGANGEFGDFRDTVELAPGAYELRAFESSAEDGRPLNVDTKAFTVR